MNIKEQMSDDFLSEAVSILKLGDFKFTKETLNTKIDINNEVKTKLKQLCANDKDKRIRFNEPNKTMNVNWSYDVMSKYFNCNF